MEHATYQLPKKYKHNEKGRPPLNEREAILDRVSKATKTPITRFARYSPDLLQRCLTALEEQPVGKIKNKAAYFTALLGIYGEQ